MKVSILALLAFLGIGVPAADDTVNVYYEGRLLTATGAARANVRLPATASVYAEADGGTNLSQKAFTLITDANGYFAQLISDLRVAGTLTEFYIGVSVDGGAEIRPRMKVNPAPYAVSAVTATRIETTGAVAASGTTAVGSLAAQTDVTASDTFLLSSSQAQVNGPVTGFANIYIHDLTLGDTATPDFLRCNNPGNLTLDHDSLSQDNEMSLTDTTGFFSSDYNQEKSMEIEAEADGVAHITFRMYKGADSSDWNVHATIRNGDFTVCSNRSLMTGDSGWQTRTFTVPVRKGKKLYIWAKNHRKLVTYDVKTYVKVAWTYVGAR